MTGDVIGMPPQSDFNCFRKKLQSGGFVSYDFGQELQVSGFQVSGVME
jgi:hypothetical protein